MPTDNQRHGGIQKSHTRLMDRFVPRLAWTLTVAITAGMVFLLIVNLPTVDATNPLDWSSAALFVVIPISFAATSAAILSKQPRNLVGWALMIPAVSFVLSSLISSYYVALEPVPTSLSVLDVIALGFEQFSWVLLIFPIFHLMLVFPNGRLLSPRWRVLVVLEAAMILVMVFLGWLSVELGPSEGDWTAMNPIGFITGDFFEGLIVAVWNVGLVVLALSGVAALTLRFRRAEKVERQQIKWMFLAVIFFGIIYTTSAVGSGFVVGGLADTLLGLSINLLAIAIAFGVLKYRLFDIDRFVSRTVGYAVVVGVLAVVYVGVAIWLPSSFLDGDSPLFVAGATLIVAALFNPVRRAVLRLVDRRFYRSRYDMERLVEDFSNRLQNRTDIGVLTDDWVGIVTETLQPSAIGVWIKR
jgi:hypothetical protein